MQRRPFTWVLACCIFATASQCTADDLDDQLEPSALTGAEVQPLLVPGLTTDELHAKLQTTPALVRGNRFHWELADGSLRTDFVRVPRGLRIIAWIIESDSAQTNGGEAVEFGQLTTFYYRDPKPDQIPRVVELSSLCGLLDQEHLRPVVASFLTQVFRQNPDHVAEWSTSAESLPPAHRQAVYTAIRDADVAGSQPLLQRLASQDETNREFIAQLLGRQPRDPLTDPITEPAQLDVLWAAFFATGDRRYVDRITIVLSWDPDALPPGRAMIRGAANWSLGSNSRQHPRVAEICRDLATSAEGPRKAALDAIVVELDEQP